MFFLFIAFLSFKPQVASAATNVYYSVGQSTSTNMMTGTPTMTMIGGAAIFSEAQTGNIGVGDKVTYNTNQIAYISRKTDADKMHWTLITATGTIPVNVTNVTVNSIKRVFASLNAAVTFNTGILNAQYLNTGNLITGNYIANISCYYDTGPDVTPVNGINQGWYTTGSSNYIRIYTPQSVISEANFNQRHSGVWDDAKYKLEVNSTTSSPLKIDPAISGTHIDGLQIKLTLSINGSVYTAISGGINNYISNNIVQGVLSGTVSMAYGISATNNNKIWNNIVYNFIVGTSTNLNFAGIYSNGAIFSYIYNNTVYNTAVGYRSYCGATTTAKNNIAQNTTAKGFFVSCDGANFTASSSNNLSNRADAPGSNPQNSKTVNFVSTSTSDFHLASNDTLVKYLGSDLSADSVLAFNTDIDGQTRYAPWDIGADEVQSVPDAPTNVSGAIENGQSTVSFTAPTDNGGASVTNYTVTSSPGGITASGASSPIVITGLTNGTPYTFTVTATNALGTSNPSTPSASVTPDSSILIPTVVASSTTSVTATSATLNGGITFLGGENSTKTGFFYGTTTSYGLNASTTGSFGIEAFSESITGLDCNTTYHFQAFSINSAGTGTSSDETFTTGACIPDVPTGISATIGNRESAIYFTAPSSNGGSLISYYTVTSNPAGLTATGTSSPIRITRLTNGTPYTFTVTATNAIGTSTESVASNAVIPTVVIQAYGWGDHNIATSTHNIGHMVDTYPYMDPATIAARTLALPEGKRNMLMLAFEDGAHLTFHTLDRCKDSQGNFTSYQCPWLDNGTAQLQSNVQEFMDAFVVAGGDIDRVDFDFEGSFTTWGMNAQQMRAIIADPRSVALEAEMAPYHLADALYDERSKMRFNAVMTKYSAEALQSVFNIIKAYFPDLKGSNYGHTLMDEANVMPDQNYHFQYGNEVVGTDNTWPFYGWMSQIANFSLPGLTSNLGTSTYKDLLWNVKVARAMRRSAPDAPLRPWIGWKGWTQDTAGRIYIGNTPYYDELIYHLALNGAKDFMYFNPHPPYGTVTDADDIVLDSLLDDLSSRGITQLSTTTTLADLAWNEDVVATGMEINPTTIMWRISVPNGEGTVNVIRGGIVDEQLAITPGEAGVWYTSTVGDSVSFALPSTPLNNLPPIVSIGGLPATSTTNVVLSPSPYATVSDPDGTINSVTFFWDRSIYGHENDTTPPYGVYTNFSFDGPHTLVASAKDNQGATTISAPATITVIASVPTLTTTAPTGITDTGVTANGNVSNFGGTYAIFRGFEYGTTTAYGLATTTLGIYGITGAYSAAISGLACDTIYHVRSYATNAIGTGYGNDQTFTTTATSSCIPSISSSNTSSISVSSATLNGSITSLGGENADEHGFAWGTSASLSGGDTSTTTIGAKSGTGAFTSSLTGLTCATTYYARGYATNSAGTGYGDIVSFTTSACPVAVSTTTPTPSGSTSSSGSRSRVWWWPFSMIQTQETPKTTPSPVIQQTYPGTPQTETEEDALSPQPQELTYNLDIQEQPTNIRSLPNLFKNFTLSLFKKEDKEKLPSEVVFAKPSNLLSFDVSTQVSLQTTAQSGVSTQQATIHVPQGKPIDLAVKVDKPVKEVVGYLTIKKIDRKTALNDLEKQEKAGINTQNLASALSALETIPEDKFVLLTFNYTDPDNDGIYTATIDSPKVTGEYDIMTILEYKDKKLGYRELHLTAVIDPEGYVYVKSVAGKTRIENAKITLFDKNSKTGNYSVWQAEKFKQVNPQITDDTGNYSFLVPEGTYQLTVSAPGYYDFTGTEFIVAQGAGVHENIELTKHVWWKSLWKWLANLI